MNELETLIEQVNNFKKRIREDSSTLLGAYLKEALTKTPVKSMRWEQYTPYFNDGDPCTFRVGEIRLSLNASSANESDEDDEDEDDGDYEDGHHDRSHFKGYGNPGEKWYSAPHPEAASVLPLFTAMDKVPDEIMEAAFGDHCRVTVTPGENGSINIDVEEYSHD